MFTIGAHAQTAIITKARAYLGSEAALDAVKTIHYTGKLTGPDPADATKQIQATVDIIYKKPDRHRLIVTFEKSVETTGLEGYEGWRRVQDIKDPNKASITLLPVEQTKRVRANTWENVAFFRGLDARGGKVEVMGPVTHSGVLSDKIAFIHAPNIVFNRFFDQNTGKLVATETESGSLIREEGEISVAGIRFPKSITTVSKNAAGKTQTMTITFDQIKVNEVFPDSVFAFPSLGRK
ncbi:MAG: hypothetical protein ABIZ81_11855 [Opitutaceae bacterium]